MIIIPGKKKGSFLLFHNGYKYARNYDSDFIYRCSKRKSYMCSARIKFFIDVPSIDYMENVTDDDFEVIGSHQDMPDYTINEWLDMVDTMKQRCRTSHDRLIDIFNDVCRDNPEVATNYSYQSVSAILSRERASSRSPIPKTLLELSQSLNDTSVVKVHLVAGESSVLIFTSTKLLIGFAESNELFMDGTFSNTSRKPCIHQIYTIHFKYKKEYHAGALILTEKRDTDTYVTIFNWLIKYVPVLKNKEITIMTDYEKSTIKALRTSFPCAKIHGCFFHFVQAVIKRWQKLKIKITDSVLSMYLSVPLLPSKYFEKAARCLEEEMNKVKSIDNNILKFHDYSKDTWLKHPEHVSVFNLTTRSTGGPESFHRHNKAKLGGVHPIVWKLIDGIEKIVMDEEINYSRLNNGLPTKKHTPQYLIDRCNYIRKMQDDLENGLNVKEFLKMFPKCFEELQYTIKKLITDSELHLIEDESDPSTLDIKRKSEETAGIHKSLKHLENITNKIDSRLSTGQVTINTWLQRKKKGRKKTNFKNSSKQLNKLNVGCKYVFKPISHSNPLIVQRKPVTMSSILMEPVNTSEAPPITKNRINSETPPASSLNGINKDSSITVDTSIVEIISESSPEFSSQNGIQKNKSTASEPCAVETISDKSSEFSKIRFLEKYNPKKQLDFSRMKKIPISALKIPIRVSKTRLSSLIRVTSETLATSPRHRPQESIKNKSQTSATETFSDSLFESSVVMSVELER